MDEFDGSEMQCSYCGKWICADVARCPKCGEYTDGLGRFQDPGRAGRRIPRIFVIAGWLVLAALLVPLAIVLIQILFSK